jgi:hypothetical protein
VDDADPGPARRRRALHLLDVQLLRRHGRARDQAGTERHLLPDRRGGGAGRDPRSRDADHLRPQGIAPRLRRRRQAHKTTRSASRPA